MTAEALRPAYSRGRVRGVSKLAAARQAGLPAGLASAAVLLAAALIAVVTLATGGRGERLIETGQAAARTDLASLGFRVDTIHLQGATAAARKQIIAAANLQTGAPILSVDLAALRDRVRQVGWVSDARVFRMLPGTLVIAVDQRPLMAVWQHAGQFVVVADNGTPMPDVAPGKFGELPLIIGDGRHDAAAAGRAAAAGGAHHLPGARGRAALEPGPERRRGGDAAGARGSGGAGAPRRSRPLGADSRSRFLAHRPAGSGNGGCAPACGSGLGWGWSLNERSTGADGDQGDQAGGA